MTRHAKLLALAAPLGGMLAIAPATATGAKQQQVTIELIFLWKSLPVWRMAIDARLNARGYAVKTTGKALGIVWAFTRWTTTSSAEGSIKGSRIEPLRYRSDSKFRSRKSLIELTYPAPGRTVTRVTPPNSIKDWTPVPAALRQGAPDPLTAIVSTLRFGGDNPCDWQGEIYDGRRRYRLSFRREGEDELKSTMWNRYAGPAIRCRVVRKTLAGWYKKSRSEKDPQRPAPTIWFARFATAGIWLPVKLVARTRWGEVRGELFRYKLAPVK